MMTLLTCFKTIKQTDGNGLTMQKWQCASVMSSVKWTVLGHPEPKPKLLHALLYTY